MSSRVSYYLSLWGFVITVAQKENILGKEHIKDTFELWMYMGISLWEWLWVLKGKNYLKADESLWTKLVAFHLGTNVLPIDVAPPRPWHGGLLCVFLAQAFVEQCCVCFVISLSFLECIFQKEIDCVCIIRIFFLKPEIWIAGFFSCLW